MELEDAMRRVIDAFVGRLYTASCLVSSAAVAHLMGRGDVVEGYKLEDRHSRYYRHYWYRLDDVDYDVGGLITQAVIPQLGNPGVSAYLASCMFRLSTQQPAICEGCDDWSRVDIEDKTQLRELEAGYRTYKQTPRRFWKKAAPWMRRLIK